MFRIRSDEVDGRGLHWIGVCCSKQGSGLEWGGFGGSGCDAGVGILRAWSASGRSGAWPGGFIDDGISYVRLTLRAEEI